MRRLGEAQVRLGWRVGRSTGGIETSCTATAEAVCIGDVSGERCNDVGGVIDHADEVVIAIGDVDVVARVDAQSPGVVEFARRGWTAVAQTAAASAGVNRNRAARSDLPDHVVGAVGDVNIVAGVDDQTGEYAELGTGCNATAERVAKGSAGGCEDTDVLGGVVDPANDVILSVCEEEVAAGVIGDAHGIVELGGGCKASVPGAALAVQAGNEVHGGGSEEDCRRRSGGRWAVLLREGRALGKTKSERGGCRYPEFAHHLMFLWSTGCEGLGWTQGQRHNCAAE